MKLIDTGHPWFRPLWRRIAILVLCALWTLIEMINGTYGWALITALMGAIALYKLFLTYPKT